MEALKLDNNDILLTTEQVAELLKATRKTITNWIINGKITAIQEISNKGRGGISYKVPLSSLDDKAQLRYWKKADPKAKAQVPEIITTVKRIDEYSAEERKVIQAWIDAINDWQAYRIKNSDRNFGEVDAEWIQGNTKRFKNINLSIDTIYRKWKAYKSKDFDGLIDKRGKWAKGTNTIPEVAWELFKYYYLDENKHPVSKCVQYVTWYFEKEIPELLDELPSYHAFNRAIKTIPYAVIKLFREGDKAFEDKAAPYITRIYDDLEVNYVWVADAHIFDVMSIENGVEKVHRLTVVAFADARSKMITGWHITNNTSSEAVLMALRKGILKYGIPNNILVDNGTEFLCFDIGGRGHRRKRKEDNTHIPPGVFARLGIDMWNAKVRNAKAKIIERIFKEFKDNFSRIMTSFCGGNVLEKPEKLKKVLKSRKGVILDSDFIQSFETYIEGMYNETESNGLGMYGRSPIQVYRDELIEKRVAAPEDLNLMLMRSTRMQSVGRKGVYIEICGEKLFYWNPEFVFQYEGQKVYVRYDPDDLSEVRVYNEADIYVCTVEADIAALRYGESKAKVKEVLHTIKKVKKMAKEYKENDILDILPKFSAMDIMLWKARKNIDSQEQAPEAKVLKPVRANESVRKKEVKPDISGINMEKMIENARKKASMG